MSTTLLENFTNGLEGSIRILSDYVKSRKTPTFAEYVQAAMDDLGLNSLAVERDSKTEAARRGVEVSSYSISDQTVTDIISGKPGNYQRNKLFGLAWAIHRPIEEVVAYAFDFAARQQDYQISEAFKLWEMQQRFTGEQASYYAQRIADLKREMDTASKKPKK